MPALRDLVPTDGTERPASGLLGPDTVIAQTYRITRLLGAGGMGEVYEAEHMRLGRSVAVKILRSGSDQRAINRFRRETRVVAALESDHVVGVFDCGALHDGTPYLVMELLRGEDLRSLLSSTGPLTVARAVRIVQQAARGVSAAHRADIVHRDLKPENLFLVRRDGDGELCKVLDFGVAKTDTSELTQQGTVIGTIKYMAPEQLEDSTRVGPSTDVYALGVILYECLVGGAPHEASTARETMLKILTEPVRPVRERRPDVPEALAAIVLRALARQPEERFQTGAELDRALEPFASESGVRGVDPGLFAAAATIDILDVAGRLDSPAPAAALGSSPGELAMRPRREGARRLFLLGLSVGLAGLVCGAALVWLLLRRELPTAPPSDQAAIATPVIEVREAPVSSLAPVHSEDAPREPAAEARVPAALDAPAKPARPGSLRSTTRPEVEPQGGLPSLRLERENPYDH